MISKVFYLATFLAGLALGVHVMLHGIERWRRRRSARPSAAFNPPTASAFAIGVGVSGYLISTRSDLAPAIVLLISIGIGAIAFVGSVVLMAKWALRNTEAVHADEEDVNGQVATVTQPITPDESGVITWHAWGRTHSLPATSVGQDEIPVGTEVVIDLVENGTARVELWSVVEGRL